jgi:hypothetical protein
MAPSLFSGDSTEDDIHIFEAAAFGFWDEPVTDSYRKFKL